MNNKSYQIVSTALEFISDNWENQPDLEQISQAVGMNEFNFQKLFTNWIGISPKKFLSVLTLEQAKGRLETDHTILNAALDSGLSGPSRLHDLFVNFEAMTPGEYKKKAEGLTIFFGWHDGIFGRTLVLVTDRGLCGLAFEDHRGEDACFEDMATRWPKATLIEKPAETNPYMDMIFCDRLEIRKKVDKQNLKLFLKGTEFQVKVWQALMELPTGGLTTYGDIAKKLNMPTGASRAIGTAVGNNPVSWIIPCHRVIRNTGYLGGYRWGLPRKLAMMGMEAAS